MIQKPRSNIKTKKLELMHRMNMEDLTTMEIGLDESGRGPMFGRVYAAGVVLPTEIQHPDFDYSLLRDSKTIKSKKKMRVISDYIKTHALSYHISYVDVETIDKINVLQADMKAMHECICEIITPKKIISTKCIKLLIDGNYFTPYPPIIDEETDEIRFLSVETIEKGDGKVACIAAASILAKDARDQYIHDLCVQYPLLVERYGIDTNMGYGTKRHLDGIREYGITQFHRQSFGICKTSPHNFI
jgi:ribonuclease HII